MGAENAVSSQEGIVGVHFWSKDLETICYYGGNTFQPYQPKTWSILRCFNARFKGIQRYLASNGNFGEKTQLGMGLNQPIVLSEAPKGNSSEATADIWHPTTPKLSHPQRCDDCQLQIEDPGCSTCLNLGLKQHVW